MGKGKMMVMTEVRERREGVLVASAISVRLIRTVSGRGGALDGRVRPHVVAVRPLVHGREAVAGSIVLRGLLVAEGLCVGRRGHRHGLEAPTGGGGGRRPKEGRAGAYPAIRSAGGSRWLSHLGNG